MFKGLAQIPKNIYPHKKKKINWGMHLFTHSYHIFHNIHKYLGLCIPRALSAPIISWVPLATTTNFGLKS